jgi:hypothetical protein
MSSSKIQIRQFVVWGYKLHSHTHSYIHNAFYHAFQYRGLPVLWLDETDDISRIDFSRTLFLTEHNVNKQIPCRKDCLYLTHYVDVGDYPGVPKEHIIVLKMSQRDFTEEDKDWGKGVVYEELRATRGYGEPWEYHAQVEGYHCWYTYWATDIFPSQIDENIQKLESGEFEAKRTREIHFVGHMEEIWVYFKMLCDSNGIPFHHHGASFSRNSERNRSTEENMDLIQKSWFAPAFQSDHQVKHRYLPCRLFKNISYGKMGMTNNPAMVELLGKYLKEGEQGPLFSREVIELVSQGIEYEHMAYTENGKKRLKRLMEIIRDHHTFLNRLETLRNFIEDYTPDFALVWGL